MNKMKELTFHCTYCMRTQALEQVRNPRAILAKRTHASNAGIIRLLWLKSNLQDEDSLLDAHARTHLTSRTAARTPKQPRTAELWRLSHAGCGPGILAGG